MKIELEVDPKDLTKSLKEILDTLPPAERLELARKAMEKWLKEPYDIERKAKEEEVLSRHRVQRDYNGRTETDDEIRRSYKFGDEMRGWKSTKEQMISSISQEISLHYKQMVNQVVNTDPAVQAMKDEVVKVVKETFPKIFHDAMVSWTASNVQTMLESSMGMQAHSQNAEKFQQAVAERIAGIEGRLSSRMM